MARLLDRLQAANMSDRGVQTWAQRVCEQIEAAFADIQGQVADIQAALDAAAAAEAAAAAADAAAAAAQTQANTATTNAATAQTQANTATTNAATAQTTANTGVTNAATAQTQANTATTNAATADAKAVAASREAARIASYTQPTSVLTAADVGTTATITIAAHNRIYPVQGTYDVPDVACAGGTITGRAFSTKYWVYYDDTTLADTTPSYLSTTTQLTAQVGTAAGRHLVGVVTTPADGGAGTSGSGGLPPAGGGGDGTVLP